MYKLLRHPFITGDGPNKYEIQISTDQFKSGNSSSNSKRSSQNFEEEKNFHSGRSSMMKNRNRAMLKYYKSNSKERKESITQNNHSNTNGDNSNTLNVLYSSHKKDNRLPPINPGPHTLEIKNARPPQNNMLEKSTSNVQNQIEMAGIRNNNRKKSKKPLNENPNSQDKPQLHMSDIKIFENTDNNSNIPANIDNKHNKINSLTNNTSNNQSDEITMKINQGHEIIDIIEKNISDDRKEFIPGTNGNPSLNEFLKMNSNINNNFNNINNSTDNNSSPNLEEYNSRDNLKGKVLVKIPRKGRSIGDYLQNLKK